MSVHVASPRRLDVCQPLNVTCDVTCTDGDIRNVNYVKMTRRDSGRTETRIMKNGQLTSIFVNDRYRRYSAVKGYSISKDRSEFKLKMVLMIKGRHINIEYDIDIHIHVHTYIQKYTNKGIGLSMCRSVYRFIEE